MRTHPIVTVTAIVIASLGAAYYLLPDHALPRPVEAAKPTRSATASLTGTRLWARVPVTERE